jgi:hypothetical protein
MQMVLQGWQRWQQQGLLQWQQAAWSLQRLLLVCALVSTLPAGA